MSYLDVIAPPTYEYISSFILLLTVAVALFLISSTVLVVVAFLKEYRNRQKKPEAETPKIDDPHV